LFGLILAAAAAAPPEPRLNFLKKATLEDIHAQRVDWKKKHAPLIEPEGVYRDYRTIILSLPPPPNGMPEASRDAEVDAVLYPGAGQAEFRGGVLFMQRPEMRGVNLAQSTGINPDLERAAAKLAREYPEEIYGARGLTEAHVIADWDRRVQSSKLAAFATTNLSANSKLTLRGLRAELRSITTHVLAKELKESEIVDSLEAGHSYVAHDWLCDPAGFEFSATNYFGSFAMGDDVAANPLFGSTRINAKVPVPARLRLYRNGMLVAEVQDDTSLAYELPADFSQAEGVYRLEASLKLAGSEQPWIFSNPLYIRKPWDIRLPSSTPSPDVQRFSDIEYVDGDSTNKQRLDLYVPKAKQHFPVLVFYHGGGWVSGDRSLYSALGNRLARAGIGVAIPSYRLMPMNPHPAQVEDAASAFDWIRSHIAEYGGDPTRLYVGGHSSGGHLASLLALDPRYLEAHHLESSAIRGVISMSGVYNVDRLLTFIAKGPRSDASPLHHVHPGAPPFLVSYCQWDYLGLPRQARNFAAALRKQLVATDLVYIPGDSHISEIINLTKDDGRLIEAVLHFIH
jgi:acetyl esterase/lipase